MVKPLRWLRFVWLSAAAAVGLVVVLSFCRFHTAENGFTYVLDFGETIDRPRLADVSRLPIYVHEGVPGYDSQFYSQLALDPWLTEPELESVIDSFPYRSRRLLMGAVAWTIGLGDPWRVLNAYAVINLATWIALAAMLLRWFPPVGVHEFLRWSGVMLAGGTLLSLRHALTDGPALLVLAVTMLLYESRRPWAAAISGALGSLTRETSVLDAVIFLPTTWNRRREWLVACLRGLVVMAPLVFWMAYVNYVADASVGDGAGHRNLTLPLVAYFGRWKELISAGMETTGAAYVVYALLGHLALTVQAAWMVCRPQWSSAWWRVGAVHVVLMAALGEAVWEGFPGAAMRVLLPLTLAFNVLVPKTRLGLALLVVGNLSVLSGIQDLEPPPRAISTVTASEEVQRSVDVGMPVIVRFGEGFYGPENFGERSWRWTSGDARMELVNNTTVPLTVRLRLTLATRERRPVRVVCGERELWAGDVEGSPSDVDCGLLTLPVGETFVAIRSRTVEFAVGDDRPLAVRVFGVDVRVEAIGPDR